MAVLSRDDFFGRLQSRIGDDTSDEAMSFIEDMTDTFNDMETRSTGTPDADWQQRYDELDRSWREKYKARFFDAGTTPQAVISSQTEDVIDDSSEKTFTDLFIEREG